MFTVPIESDIGPANLNQSTNRAERLEPREEAGLQADFAVKAARVREFHAKWKILTHKSAPLSLVELVMAGDF